MSRVGRVAKNSLILGLQQVAVNLLSVFVVGYIARQLGKIDYGVFSLAFTFTVFFSFIGHLGLRSLTIREVAKEKENSSEYLGKIIPARLILIALMTVVIPLAAILLNYDIKIVAIVAIAALAAMFEQLSRIINDVFQAYEEMGKVASRDIIVRLFTGGASIAVLFYGYGLVAVSWIYVVGAFIGLVYNVVLFDKRFSWPRMRIDYIFIKKNLQEGVSFLILGIASAMYTQIDVFIISKLLNIESVGIYNASASLFSRLGFIADAIATASFPSIAQLYWNDKRDASEVLAKSIIGVIIFAFPIAVGGFILSDDIIGVIYGKNYIESSVVFKVLILSLPFLFISMQLNYALGAIKLQKTVLYIVASIVVFNIISTVILVNIFGLVGAAISKYFSELLGFLIFICISCKYFKFDGVLRSIYILVFPIFTMVVTIFLIKDFGLIFTVIGGAFSYGVILSLFGGMKYIRALKK